MNLNDIVTVSRRFIKGVLESRRLSVMFIRPPSCLWRTSAIQEALETSSHSDIFLRNNRPNNQGLPLRVVTSGYTGEHIVENVVKAFKHFINSTKSTFLCIATIVFVVYHLMTCALSDNDPEKPTLVFSWLLGAGFACDCFMCFETTRPWRR